MSMRIEPVEPRTTTFAGEGRTHRFRQGFDAISGVAAHEAANIVALSAQAARAGQVVIDKAVELHFALDPATGRLVVVGGRSRITYRPPRVSGSAVTAADPTEIAGSPEGAVAVGGSAPEGPHDPQVVLRQAEQALDQRIADLQQRLVSASDAERPLLEAELRALERRREHLAQVREALDLQRSARREAAPPVPGATAAARRPSGAPRPARGIFIPAMTQSGLLVNASV